MLRITPALAVLLMLASSAAQAGPAAMNRRAEGKSAAMALFAEALARVRADYVDDIDTDKLVEAAVSGMIVSLDPHSKYLPPDKYADIKSQNDGEYGGIGVEMTVENGLIKVIEPFEDSPA